MYDGGYSQKRTTNSFGLGIIVAGHAALLLTIALNPTIVQRAPIWIQEVQTIRDDPPPPIDPPPLPKPQPTEPTAIKIDPLVKTDLPRTIDIPLQPIPLDPPVIPKLEPVAEPLFRQAVMDPKAMGRFQPPYPSSMVRGGIEGSVTVKVLIGADGRVQAIELVKATNPDFFASTRDHALRAWRFQPATRDGVAVESWRTMTVKFLLES